MTLLKIKPRLMSSIPSSFDKVLAELINEQKENQNEALDFSPKVNIKESETEYTVQLALPGYNKKNIKIGLDKDLLKIQGEKEVGKEEDAPYYQLKQIESGKFSRSFYLPEGIAEDEIEAKFEDGLLSLHFPKVEQKVVKRSIQNG